MRIVTERALWVEVLRGPKTEVLEVAAGRALVGSGAHCDVRLLPDEAAPEQLVLEVEGDEVRCRVLTTSPACVVEGDAFAESRGAPGTRVRVGGVVLTAGVMERSEHAGAGRDRGAQTPPALQIVALVGLAVGYFFVLSPEPPPPSALDAKAEPPRLFQSEKPESCPTGEPRAAESLANQALGDAEVRRERSPFHLRDGMLAVPLYRRAAACFDKAGEVVLAGEASRAADDVTTWLNDELHLRHVRIERLIATQKFESLRHELQLTAALVPDSGTPYAQWLSALAREVELRTAERK